MEVADRVVKECKTLDAENRQLSSELSELEATLIIKEREKEMLANDIEDIEESLDEHKKTTEASSVFQAMTDTVRDIYLSSGFHNAALRTFIKNAQPDVDRQLRELATLQANFLKTLNQYEESPLYKKLLQQQVAAKDLENTIMERNREKMKLETSKSFWYRIRSLKLLTPRSEAKIFIYIAPSSGDCRK